MSQDELINIANENQKQTQQGAVNSWQNSQAFA
jgi:hypothetical protein